MSKYVLITGASAGIGYEIAKEFAAKKYNLILVARREERLSVISKDLAQKYNIEATYIVADLSDPSSPQMIYNKTHALGLNVEILVNNAGYSINKKFHSTDELEEDNFLRVLGVSVIHLTKLYLKDMLSKNSGRIMNVSSLAAFAPPATGWGAMYGPIKTFINRFGDTININYNSKGITATNVCPGFTVTEFHTASGMQDAMDKVPAIMKHDSKYVAKGAVKATLKGKQVWVPGLLNKTLAFICNVFPSSLVIKLSSRLAGGRYE
jgi:short-subunit dehydrogenase